MKLCEKLDKLLKKTDLDVYTWSTILSNSSATQAGSGKKSQLWMYDNNKLTKSRERESKAD